MADPKRRQRSDRRRQRRVSARFRAAHGLGLGSVASGGVTERAMSSLIARLFPSLSDRVWAEVDLNEEALARRPADSFRENPLLDAAAFDAFVQEIARDRGADFTYGGWLEWRGHVLRGTYMKPDEMRHLGVDYNAPAGTDVHLPADGLLVEVKRDLDQDGGWGGRLVFQRPANGLYFVLAHLAHGDLPDARVGEVIAKGARIASIGSPAENGNWFAHLHVQCVAAAEFAATRGLFDGYAGRADDLAARYPSPDVALAV